MIPSAQLRRYEILKGIFGERISISQAALELGIARVNMQSLHHRVEAAIVEALMPRSPGPSPKSQREKELEARIAALEKQNAKLASQIQAADDMMAAAGEIIRSLRGLPPTVSTRSSQPSPPSPKPPDTSDDEDPEPALIRALHRVVASSATLHHAATALGVHVTTLRRWLERLLAGEPLVRRRGGTMAPVAAQTAVAVEHHVRELGGLVGAASLARSVGISRRSAAQIKRDVVTAMERERQAECAHVCITRVGAVRGFDAMHLRDDYALIAADAAIPYRTSAIRLPSYDAEHVAAVPDADFREHGAPLVWRRDRASCHTAEPVASVLREHRVLSLAGPPRHPQYYGQLERQNLEHRAWLDRTPDLGHDALPRMTRALNGLWRRPTLGWRTAHELWSARLPLDDDRDQLHDEVEVRAQRLRANGVLEDLAMRLAIEQALINRGYLVITPARTVLCG